MTALTTYFSAAASSTLSTANQLYSTLGAPTPSGTTQALGAATGYGEIYSQGTASAWPALGSIGSPSGHGFLWDVTTLEGQQIVSGSWSAMISLQTAGTGSGTITADVHVRIYKRSSGGVSTQIIDMVAAAQSIPMTSPTTFSLSGSTSSATFFATGDKLYVDVWLDITANGHGSGQNIKLDKLSTDTSGLTGLSISEQVSPGYVPTPVLSTSPTSMSFSATIGGSNPASQNDTLSETAGTATAWTSSINYGSGSGWLSISPTSGNLSASGNATITVSCTTGSLAAGTYTATVTFTATTGGATATIAVTFTVSPASVPSITTGQWYHIMATWDGTTMKLYQNGVLMGTAALSGTVGSATNAPAVGVNPGGPSGYFPGEIDEVAIYNTALSAARVLAHYQAASEITGF